MARPARKPRITLMVLMAVLLTALLFGALGSLHRWRPDRTLYPVQGVTLDMSNGTVHWGRLKAAGADFAYLRATDGAKGRDGHFLASRDSARAAGMRIGALHVYDLCALASEQAGNFDTLVPRDADALPTAVAIDYRTGCDDRPTQAMLEGELTTFLAHVESHMGRRAILKPSAAIAADYSFAALKRPLWVERRFFVPQKGSVWRMWQASTWARIDGADGNVRWNVINPAQ